MEHAGRNSLIASHGRAAERIKLQGHAHLALAGDGEQLPLEVQLEDLSLSGAGVVASLDLRPGTAVVLLLHPLHHPPGGIRGHVLNCRKLGDEQFRIGMEFDTADGPTIKSIRRAFYPDDALNDCV